MQELEIEKEHEIDRIWSKSAAALDILKQGNIPSDTVHSRNFEDYLKSRGFASALNDESALRTLSSVMTFPLTLGYACNLIFRGFPRRETKILVLGARAESSLPVVWWNEYMYINDRVASTVIRMNGPGLQPQKQTASNPSSSASNKTTNNTQLSWNSFQPTNHPDILQVLEDWGGGAVPTVTINHQHAPENFRLLHERADVAEMLQWADMFVLFNPGVGSEPCKTQWDPTMRLLMQTRKPIVMTAFNAIDLDKDLTALDHISAEEDTQAMGEPLEFIFAPHENPFQSLRRTIDKKAPEGSESRIVAANQYLYALQSK
jgi:splicing suppressor protein 51